ncbi:LysR family transcriptional regulator [Staphylococcus pettenkoferi]|uniref:LysR family transcriptional regulator n=1 Tax=Staphylococcus pettenkoferi TaxID=170573 RepID=UPI000CD1E782|nr:LysR family transcriptional regulator [Staphylococcus pettenkoferi]PNZ86781.1 LysR family transcriptional regulator [Staphylococcus pettenkoferi]QQC36391.1 LysR family transcriptional regulator [Staphylococcus pettenkoferi]
MENRVLRYFLTVVSEGNISAAAKLLHITQPTLSRQLRDLEEELDTVLFIRKGKQIELTQEGYYLFNQARDIINLVDKTARNITNKKIIGEVAIGMAESEVNRSVMKAIKEVTREEQEVKFDTFSGNGEQILEKLDNGLIDFGIIVEPINKVNYESLPLNNQDVWGILTRRDSELGELTSVSATRLFNQPLIISRQDGVKTMLANLLEINEVEMNIIANYNLLYNASLMVEAGIGHAICLDGIINTTGTDLKFIPFDNEITSSLSVIWKKERALSLSAQLFLNKLKDVLKEEE